MKPDQAVGVLEASLDVGDADGARGLDVRPGDQGDGRGAHADFLGMQGTP
jgi:hypothetical protein